MDNEMDIKVGTIALVLKFVAETDNPSLARATIQDSLNIAKNYRFTDGSNQNQVNQTLHRADQILAPGVTQDFDLRGVMQDGLGQVVTLLCVKGLFIYNKSGLTTDAVLEIGGAAYSAWAELFGDSLHKMIIRPGGIFLWVDPTATGVLVPAGDDILQVKNIGSVDSATFDIAVLGVQA